MNRTFDMETNKTAGFTMVELVITMVLIGIVLGVTAGFISNAMTAYNANARRAVLVNAADMALQRMARDIQAALPNSIRVKTSGTTQAVEFVNVVDGARYFAQGAAGTFLNFSSPTTSFQIAGKFQTSTIGATGYRLVVYNTGAISGGSYDSPVAGMNVYNSATYPGPGTPPPVGTNVITPLSTTVTFTSGTPYDTVTLSTGMQFAFPSPQQRLYVIDTPVTYLCSPAAVGGLVTRYSGYTIQSTQPINSGVAPLSTATSQAPLTNNVTACTFTYTPGSLQRNGILTMSLSISQSGETITLLRQVSVDNGP